MTSCVENAAAVPKEISQILFLMWQSLRRPVDPCASVARVWHGNPSVLSSSDLVGESPSGRVECIIASPEPWPTSEVCCGVQSRVARCIENPVPEHMLTVVMGICNRVDHQRMPLREPLAPLRHSDARLIFTTTGVDICWTSTRE